MNNKLEKGKQILMEILEEAEYRLGGGRSEGQVWDYIYKALPSPIKGRIKRMEFADNMYNIVAKRCGEPLIK
jgi:hypothetical protein